MFCKNHINDNKIGENDISDFYYFDIKPVTIYSDDKIISISYIIDSYTEGGAHHNYENISFNYNLITNKVILFEDVFLLETKIDSTDFLNYAELFTNGCNDWNWNELIFSFENEGIHIHPNLSWACSGTSSILPYSEENLFLKKHWIK